MKVSSLLKPVLLASFCGLSIGSIYFYSKSRIELNRIEYESRQLKQVAGLDDVRIEKVTTEQYEIWQHDKMLGYIYGIETQQGYNGRISAWLAVDTGYRVLGVRIKSHKETPGLGDKIDHRISNWIDQFIGETTTSSLLSASQTAKEWRIIKDGGKFDQFTGATVTPRAVVKMVYNKLVTLDPIE